MSREEGTAEGTAQGLLTPSRCPGSGSAALGPPSPCRCSSLVGVCPGPSAAPTQSSAARVRIYSRDTAQRSEGDVQQPVHPESASCPAGHVGNRTLGAEQQGPRGPSCPAALAGQTDVAGCANVVMLERGGGGVTRTWRGHRPGAFQGAGRWTCFWLDVRMGPGVTLLGERVGTAGAFECAVSARLPSVHVPSPDPHPPAFSRLLFL